MSIIIPFFGTNVITQAVPETKFILVATNTTTGTAKALIKYDLDGNEVASATYNQVGANVNWRPRVIFSESDDEDFYYCCGDSTSGRITKFNKDLTIATQSANLSSSPEIIVVGKDMPIFTSSTAGYAMRSKTDFTQTASVGNSTNNKKVWYRITDEGVSPPKLAFITIADGMRVLTTNSEVSSYSTIWSNVSSTYDAVALLYNPSTNGAITGDAIGGIYLSDIDIDSNTSISNFTPTIRFAKQFSNGDVVYFDGNQGDIRRKTWNNIITDDDTDVWTITLSNVVWLDIDTNDNVYVITSSTTNNVRKYNSSGTLVWQKTSVASTANFGGGLAHK